MCRMLFCTVNMNVKMMHQAAVMHNLDFTAVIKHVTVNQKMMRILIS